MDTQTLKDTISLYEGQLKQVEAALLSDNTNSDLVELRENLREVISLTQESLLSLTKSQVLQSLEHERSYSNLKTTQSSANHSQPIDEEYAAFQAALGDDVMPSTSLQSEEVETGCPTQEQTILSSQLDDVIGTCVRAPFSHSWGGYQYHDAAIIGLDTDNQKVHVMYLHPTHISMVTCTHYLSRRCRYSDDECNTPHGHLIHIDDFREYHEVDNSSLTVGDSCLAKFDYDDLWYKATIVDTHGEKAEFLQVMFDDYGESMHAVPRSDIRPLQDSGCSTSSDDESDDESVSNEETITNYPEEEETPTYLWKPDDSGLAQWEMHTRGVGSKLMAAMGYKSGDGLGKSKQGRIEPVPILKLPPGKSLDMIMELKQKTGNKDMFDVMSKNKKRKLPPEHKSAAIRPKQASQLFLYLNKALSHRKKVDITSYRKSKRNNKEKTTPAVISKHQLSQKSDKSLNIQVIKTEEEITRVEAEILSIKQRLEVNESRRDSGGIKHLTDKLIKAQSYLSTLKTSHKELSRHKGQRSDKKKLMIF